MESSLKRAHKRAPSTWQRAGGAVLVTCSKLHTSILKHEVRRDGTLAAPTGVSPSLHCGWCNEELPLKLADWSLP